MRTLAFTTLAAAGCLGSQEPAPDLQVPAMTVDLAMTHGATTIHGCYSTFLACEQGGALAVHSDGVTVGVPFGIVAQAGSTLEGSYDLVTGQLHAGRPIDVTFGGLAATTAIPAAFDLLAPQGGTRTRHDATLHLVWTPTGAAATTIDADYGCSGPNQAEAATALFAMLPGDPGEADVDLGVIGDGGETCDITLAVRHAGDPVVAAANADGTGARLDVRASQAATLGIHLTP